MPALAHELKNFNQIWQAAGISRTHIHELRAAIEKYGHNGAYTAGTPASAAQVRGFFHRVCLWL